MNTKEITPGTTVQDEGGRLGLVLDDERKAGPFKGKVVVHWFGNHYGHYERPAELTPVTLTATEKD